MNKQALYVLGGALLTTTALSTGHAATIKSSATLAGAVPPTAAITPYGLSTQVFSTSSTVAAALTLGGTAATTTAANTILIDFSAQLSSAFNLELDISNAGFTGSAPTVTSYYQSASGATTTTGTLKAFAAGSVTGCSVQVLPDKILLTNCDVSTASGGVGATHIDAMAITGITYNQAGDLATAGHSITLSGQVRNSSNTITFENITAAAVITSKLAYDTAIQAGATATIDNTATPVFALLSASGLTTTTTAVLGTVHFSGTGAVAADLSASFLSAASLTSTAEVKVVSSSLSDPALVSVSIPLAGLTVTKGGTQSAALAASGTASFQVPAASLANAAIVVTFNGTSAISVTTGTPTATVTPTAVSALLATAVPAFSGSLATFSRGGLSVEINSILQSTSSNAAGTNGYRSFIRIANNSTIDGAAVIVVKNDTTGAVLGTFTTGTIKAGGTLTVTATDVESGVSGALASGASYKLVVGGSFNGYVQHLLYNVVSGVFSDMSGFRKGALATGP